MGIEDDQQIMSMQTMSELIGYEISCSKYTSMDYGLTDVGGVRRFYESCNE